jgi:integrase
MVQKGESTMRKLKLPRGVFLRGLSIGVRFALADGRIERRIVGPASQVSPKEAEHRLFTFKEQVRQGTYRPASSPAPQPTQTKVITVSALWEVYIVSYRNNGGRSAWRLKIAWGHLKPLFETRPVGDVTTALVGEYIAARQAHGKGNATINRELTLLKAMFNMGARHTPPLVERIPYFGKKLKEPPPRKGFIGDAQYGELKRNAKYLWLRTLLALAYAFGFRKSEMLNLRCEQVDLFSGEIRLGHDTKSGQPRLVPMTSEVYQLMVECLRGKNPNDYVLTRDGSGERIVDFRDDWKELVRVSGMPELHLHDLRRSAVRNMVRRGIPERVAMAISGHQTRSIFDRYNIVDTSDLIAASAKLEKPLGTDTELTHAIHEQN